MSETRGTRQQERARGAYHRVFVAQERDWKEKYGRMCRRLPFLILECGLCQTLAFLQSKVKRGEKTEFGQVLNDLSAVAGNEQDGSKYAEKARNVGVTEYQRMTREALECAQWFKRYAEALGIGSEDEEG